MSENLWNMSTSVRNPERLPGFLQVAALLDGAIWDKACQERFQIMLIQHRKYLSESEDALTFRNLSTEQIGWLKDKTLDMTYEQAESIFRAKKLPRSCYAWPSVNKSITKIGIGLYCGQKGSFIRCWSQAY